MLEKVRGSIEGSPVIYKGDYPYIISPLIDGIPSIDPAVLSEAADKMAEIGRFDCDMILTPEAMGIPYAALISIRTGIPFSVIRKRAYNLESEIEVVETTGYSTAKLYINGVRPGMKVAIVDDVVSTGGTLRAIVTGLKDAGIEISEIVVMMNKSEDIESLEKELGIPIRYAARISVEDGKVTCIC